MTTPPISFAALLNATYGESLFAILEGHPRDEPRRVIPYTTLKKLLKDHLFQLDLTTDAQTLKQEMLDVVENSSTGDFSEEIDSIMYLVLTYSIRQLDRVLDQTEQRTREQAADDIAIAIRRKKSQSTQARLVPIPLPSKDWFAGAQWAGQVVSNGLVP